jgi:hypothetical protein
LPSNDPFLRHAIGITQPRRADARRSCERAFLHRERRYFHGERTPFTAPGAGGVSPPWDLLGMRTRNGQNHRIATADAVCNPQRADGRHCCSSVRLLPANDPFLQHAIGITQPRRADARRSCGCAFVHRKNRHSFRRTIVATAPGAGGVSPPWDLLGMRTRNGQNHRIATADGVCAPQRADGGHCCSRVRLLPGNDPFLQHAIGITQPRRGDAGRS